MATKTGLQTRKLIMVTADNNNKFYDMEQLNDQEWKATWGRVGVTSTSKVYSMREWSKKYSEKVKKGYKDQTELFIVDTKKKDFAGISDSSIATIVSDLQAFANKSVQANYTVTTDQVTQKQVDAAQIIIDDLTQLVKKGASTKNFNDNLLQLWMTVPRRISNTREAILQFGTFNTNDKVSFADKMLAEEQATLDVMRGQVKVAAAQKGQDSGPDLTILDAMGLEMSPVTQGDVKIIKAQLGEISNKFVRAWQVGNKRTKEKFDQFLGNAANKRQELFWHGSRNENWWSILDSGLVLRPANAVITGKMFGYGIYFADKARKSYGYTSARGSYWARGSSNRCFMCLFDVHLGNPLHILHHSSWCYDLTEPKLKKRGNYDSVFAEGGADLRNNEYIVYNDAECTVKYLVELQG